MNNPGGKGGFFPRGSPLLHQQYTQAASAPTASDKVSNFLGELSYPLYIVHYPVMYLFYAWLIKNEIYSLGDCWPVVVGVMALCVALAYGCLKLYDQPMRKWLGSK